MFTALAFAFFLFGFALGMAVAYIALSEPKDPFFP
jgi:hypothetical protein